MANKEEFLSKASVAKELGVSRSSLYYRRKLPAKDEELKILIEEVMREHPAYGHKRIALELGINRKRILRVMKVYGLKPARRCKTPRKPGDENKEASGYPDITKRISVIGPNSIWTGDFTYIWYQGRFIYLAVVQDLWTAEILGARIMHYHSKELVLGALDDALSKYEEKPEYFHSDQGSEYTSNDFESFLKITGIGISNSPKASPWRNARQESFFGRFKVEIGDFERFETLAELMQAIYQYIFYYSNKRIHTTLKTSPIRFREKYFREVDRLKNLQSAPALPHLSTTPPLPPTPTVVTNKLHSQVLVEGTTVDLLITTPTPYRHPTGDCFDNNFSP